ncbi:MAG: FeoA family protein [Clostridia bacterium]
MLKLSSTTKKSNYIYCGDIKSSPFSARLLEIGLVRGCEFTLINSSKNYNVIIVGGSFFAITKCLAENMLVMEKL